METNIKNKNNALAFPSSSYSSITITVFILFFSLLINPLFWLFGFSNYFLNLFTFDEYDTSITVNKGSSGDRWLSALSFIPITYAQVDGEEKEKQELEQQQAEKMEEEQKDLKQEEQGNTPPISNVDDDCSSDEYFNTNYNMCLPEEEEECEDGIDDDGDGYVDNSDSDCNTQQQNDENKSRTIRK